MTITIQTGTFTLPANQLISANGGIAEIYLNTPGTGGSIKISTLGALKTSADLNVDGVSVGVYSATSGDGGNAGPAGGAGGNAGLLGSNGTAGNGNTIEIQGYNFALTFGGNLVADGGSVGA